MEWLNNPLVQTAIATLIPLALPFIVAGIGWLLIQGIALVGKLVKESQTKMDDYLLGVAVKFAEDKLGPDTGTGKEKLRMACEYVETVTKGRLKADQLEPLVRAKYVEIFGALGGLKNG